MGNNDNNKQTLLAIILVIAVLVLGIYKLFFEKQNVEVEKIDTETISIVKDNNRFFTVGSCVSKYINYLSIRDTENLLVLLSKQFKDENSVNAENLYDYTGSINETNVFSAKKMFEQRVSKNIYKYYVYGFIQQELMDSISPKQDYYLIVILDEENMTFSVEPYNGEMFK